MANPQLEYGYTRIATELLERLCKTRINGEARQMLDVIIRKTYGWGKPIDTISTSQFISATGLSGKAIYKARKKLKEMNIIGIHQKGDTNILTYSIQKDYDLWRVSPKKGISPKRGQGTPQKGTRVPPKRPYTIDTLTIDTIQKIGKLQEYVDKWNILLPTKVRRLTSTRHKHLIARLQEKDFVDNFDMICQKVLASDFLMGKKVSEGHSNFKATFDWIIKNDENYTKILEGKYENKKTRADMFGGAL